MKKRIYIFVLIFLVAAFSYRAQLNFKYEKNGQVMNLQDLEQRPGGESTATLGR
tara:strand:+ start:953 stop:1114 length:162 start_codon:yes stop_codon:yes gene_type:complete